MPEGTITEMPIKMVNSKTVDYLDFSTAKAQFTKMIDGWAEITAVTERNRALRYQKGTESADLRAQGVLREDEMYNPCRIIDTNIRREQPQFINYLTQSRRSIIFAPEEAQTIDGLENLELDFTKKARYLGWEIPFIRCIDGAQTHGWDSVELVFDENYPGNFCFHHIGHDNLIFAIDSEDINYQECVIRKELLTGYQMQSFVDTKGWDADQVDKLVQASKKDSLSGDDINCWVYKVFFKKDDTIMVSWMSPICDEYFTVPAPLFLGVRDTEVPPTAPTATPGVMDYPKTPETEFPITIYKYVESEDPVITNLYGRVRLDEAVQEAASAISSGLVNGIVRASNVYASPKATNLNGNPNAAPKAMDVILKNGAIFDQPLEFFHLPYPDQSVIKTLQAVITQNQQEQSQINFGVINRPDSGKTATEINAAQQKSSELSSVQIILISIFIRQAYAKAWRVYQNRVLQGKISVEPTLMPLFGEVVEQPTQAPTAGMAQDPMVGGSDNSGVPPQMPQPPVRLATPAKYIIKSSGDVDVVQRAENLQRKMQAWPVIANTPIAGEFLKDILRFAFPEDAARYIAKLDSAQQDATHQLQTMLLQVSNVLKAIVTGPDGKIKPEYASQAVSLQQLAGNVQQVIGASQAPSGQAPAPQPAAQPKQ